MKALRGQRLDILRRLPAITIGLIIAVIDLWRKVAVLQHP